MTLLHPSWFKRMDEIIEKRLPRDEAEKVALECAEIADRPEERKATETIRPLGSHRGEVKRAVAVIFEKDYRGFDDSIRSVDDAKKWLRKCGEAADQVVWDEERLAGKKRESPADPKTDRA